MSARERFVLSTTFTPQDDGGYRVSGVKHFCSLADAADYFFVSGVVEGSGGGGDNILSAMIRSDMSGVRVTGEWDAVGMRATASHTVNFDTVAPHDAVFGPPGRLLSADWGSFSLGYAAVYLGIAEAAYNHIREYVTARTWTPGGDVMISHPSTQQNGWTDGPVNPFRSAPASRRGIDGPGCGPDRSRPGGKPSQAILCRSGCTGNRRGHAARRGWRAAQVIAAGAIAPGCSVGSGDAAG